MRGEQGPTAIDAMQMLRRRPGDGQAVKRRRAAPNLVENNKTAICGLVENGRCFNHLSHEGGTSARQIIGGSHS